MGTFAEHLIGQSVIALDTSVFIYHLEVRPRYQALTRELFAGVESGLWEACTSIITILELAVQPHRLGRSDSAREYEAMIAHFPHLTLLDVNRDIARCAARLRAHYNK